MSTVISGTLFDPVKQSLGGARLAISENGVIEAVSPDSNPDKGFILPGFVDAHVHIESSMLTPSAFARAAVVHARVGSCRSGIARPLSRARPWFTALWPPRQTRTRSPMSSARRVCN